MNRPMTRVCIIKTKTKTSYEEKSRFHWRILSNILKRDNINSSYTISENGGGENTFQLLLRSQYYPDNREI